MPYERALPASATVWTEVELGGMLHTGVIRNTNGANPIEINFELTGGVEGFELGPGDVHIIEKEDTSLTSHGKIHTNRIWLLSPNGVACRVDIMYTTKQG